MVVAATTTTSSSSCCNENNGDNNGNNGDDNAEDTKAAATVSDETKQEQTDGPFMTCHAIKASNNTASILTFLPGTKSTSKQHHDTAVRVEPNQSPTTSLDDATVVDSGRQSITQLPAFESSIVQTLPGSVSVPGPGGGMVDNDDHERNEEEPDNPPGDAIIINNSDANLIHAVLVPDNGAIPEAEIVSYHAKKRRAWLLAGILTILVLAVVAVVVGIVCGNGYCTPASSSSTDNDVGEILYETAQQSTSRPTFSFSMIGQQPTASPSLVVAQGQPTTPLSREFNITEQYQLLFEMDGPTGDGLLSTALQVRTFQAFMENVTNSFVSNGFVTHEEAVQVITTCSYHGQAYYDQEPNSADAARQAISTQPPGDDISNAAVQASNIAFATTYYEYRFDMSFSSDHVTVDKYTGYFLVTVNQPEIQGALEQTLRTILNLPESRLLTIMDITRQTAT